MCRMHIFGSLLWFMFVSAHVQGGAIQIYVHSILKLTFNHAHARNPSTCHHTQHAAHSDQNRLGPERQNRAH